MKRNGLLWLLMLALIGPALALSGCKEKKGSRDKDDEKSSTEKSEKEKKKNKNDDDISGVYEMDEESVWVMLGQNASGFGDRCDITCRLDMDDNQKLKMIIKIDASVFISDIDNTLNYSVEVVGRGTWQYDKKDKLLTLDIINGSNESCEFSFDANNAKTDKFLEENGGEDGFKQQMKDAFSPDVLCAKRDFKITELTEDGFYARTIAGDIKKLKFNRVD